YAGFEGTIPKGNYGAGTVMIWDAGTYHAPGARTRAESERLIDEGLRKGRLSFILDGTKLHGEFSLVKLQKGKESEWLLIKKRDAFADSADVLAQERSVQSERTLDEIASAGHKRG